MQPWLDDGGLPAGVGLVSVSTAEDPGRDNYPADEWLEREGWSVPVVVDDDDGTVANSFGLSAFPFWVLVDGDGTVVAQVAGAVDLDALGAVLATLVATG